MDLGVAGDPMSSIIDSYTAQTVTWKRWVKRDQYGDVTYSYSTIKVRWQPQITRVIDSKGSEVTVSARVYTTAAVDIGDILVGSDGGEWPVVTVSFPTTLGGRVSHREVMV